MKEVPGTGGVLTAVCQKEGACWVFEEKAELSYWEGEELPY